MDGSEFLAMNESIAPASMRSCTLMSPTPMTASPLLSRSTLYTAVLSPGITMMPLLSRRGVVVQDLASEVVVSHGGEKEWVGAEAGERVRQVPAHAAVAHLDAAAMRRAVHLDRFFLDACYEIQDGATDHQGLLCSSCRPTVTFEPVVGGLTTPPVCWRCFAAPDTSLANSTAICAPMSALFMTRARLALSDFPPVASFTLARTNGVTSLPVTVRDSVRNASLRGFALLLLLLSLLLLLLLLLLLTLVT